MAGIRAVLSWLERRQNVVLALLLLGWFAPFLGAPLGLGWFYSFSIALVVAGVALPGLSLPVLAILCLFFPQNIVNGTAIFTFTILLLAIVALALISRFRSGLRGRPLSRQSWVWLVAAVAVVVSSVPNGIAHGVSLPEQIAVLRVVGFPIVVALLLKASPGANTASLSRTLSAATWTASLVAVLMVVQVGLGQWPFLDEFSISHNYTSAAFGGRPGGTVGHPIVSAYVLAALVAVQVYRRNRWWWLTSSVGIVAVVMSGSRSAWLVLAVTLGGLILVWLRRKSSPRVFWVSVGSGVAAVISALIVLALSPAVQRFLESSTALSRLNIFNDASGMYRGNRVEAAFALIAETPWTIVFGHGPGFAQQYLTEIGILDGQPASFDQSYLSFWIDFGAVGLIVFVTPFLACLLRGSALSRVFAGSFLIISAFVTVLNWVSVLATAILAVVCWHGIQSGWQRDARNLPTPEPSLEP